MRDVSITPAQLAAAQPVVAQFDLDKASKAAAQASAQFTHAAHFDESAIGGVFDGSRVLSDADPGL